MRNATIVVLRVVIALALLGSVGIQTVFVPVIWGDLTDATLVGKIIISTIIVLGVLTLQVFGVCVWMLLTKVRRGSIFSDASFRPVNWIIVAIVAASFLTLMLAAVLAVGPAPPGVVALMCGGAFVLAGMALLVVVMKALLRQAIERESEAKSLRSELDEVI